MIEIRYNTTSKELTGWWGSRFGNYEIKLKDRPNEVIIQLDIPIPDKPLDAWLYDEANGILIANLEYIEPFPPRDLKVEIDEIKARLDNIEVRARS